MNQNKPNKQVHVSNETHVALDLWLSTIRGCKHRIIKLVSRTSTFAEFEASVACHFPWNKYKGLNKFSFTDVASSENNRCIIESESDWEAFLAGPCRFLKTHQVKLRVLRPKRGLDVDEDGNRLTMKLKRIKRKLAKQRRRLEEGRMVTQEGETLVRKWSEAEIEKRRIDVDTDNVPLTRKQRKKMKRFQRRLEKERLLAEEQRKLDEKRKLLEMLKEKLDREQEELNKALAKRKKSTEKCVLEMTDFKKGNFVQALEDYFQSCEGEFEVVFQTRRLGERNVAHMTWCTTVRILSENGSTHRGVGQMTTGNGASKKLSRKRAALLMLIKLGLVTLEDVEELECCFINELPW